MSAALDELIQLKTVFTPKAAARAAELLRCLSETHFRSPAELVRLHETLLFVRAHPHSPAVLELVQAILENFAGRMTGQDRDAFDNPEISGIAGTAVSSNFSYEIARGLVARYRDAVQIDWENYAHPERLGAALARFFPLAFELWSVEPHIDWQAWFNQAGLCLAWLVEHLDPPAYDSLEIPLVWDLGCSLASRSIARLPHGGIYYHDGPLIRRSEVSLEREFSAAPIKTTRLAKPRAQRILNQIADSSAARYRELWGFTHPDPAHVYHARLGRGVDFYFFGAPKEFRLPLRAYQSGMFAKNGVPIGYLETLSLFERAEVGFNLYYTFREGETAWLYARMLKVLREHLGVTAYSIDPYQIGDGNEEAIESGAFWFYRKLGFRPSDAEILRITLREEQRIASNAAYRTPASVLRRMARAPLIYGPPSADAWGALHLEKLCRRTEPVPGFDRPDLVRAKNGPEEAGYLRLLQRDRRLRACLLRLGTP